MILAERLDAGYGDDNLARIRAAGVARDVEVPRGYRGPAAAAVADVVTLVRRPGCRLPGRRAALATRLERPRLVATRANGQPAFGIYVRDPRARILHGVGLIVLTLAGDRICVMTRFDTSVLAYFGLPRILPD